MFEFAYIGISAGGVPATISAVWENITVAFATTTGTNSDRTISFGGGTRLVSTDGENVAVSLEYRINSGSWVAYSTAFSLTSGQTVGWRATFSDNGVTNANVYVGGEFLDQFTLTATGFP